MSEFAAWRRLDRPGSDAALLRPQTGGWLLQGAAAFDNELGPATVAYQVEVDARWETRRGIVSGFLGDKTVRREILRDDRGWRLDGVPVQGLKHLVDLDSDSLIELPQIYERRGDATYWYEAPTVPYQALLEIAPNGFVRSYPGLWRLVA